MTKEKIMSSSWKLCGDGLGYGDLNRKHKGRGDGLYKPVSRPNTSSSVLVANLLEAEDFETFVSSGIKMATISAMMTRIVPNAKGGPGMIFWKQNKLISKL